MPVVAQPTITDAPLSPDRADRATFSARAIALDEFTKNTQIPQLRLALANVFANSTDAATSATTAVTQAGQAAADRVQTGLDRTAASASAASAAALAGAFVGTSTSSVLISTGSKSFATQTFEQYTAGIFLSAVSVANPSNFVMGQVTSYNATTGALVLAVQVIGGTGTFADWNLSLVGTPGPPGAGVTPQAVGFTLSGGTVAKTLTLDVDLVASSLGTPDALLYLLNVT